MMKKYRLWRDTDGQSREVDLEAEPRDGDVIVNDDIEYTVAGRRFIYGKLHYVVSAAQSAFDDENEIQF